jgi:hypothetical protein
MTSQPVALDHITAHDTLHSGVSATIDVYVDLSRTYAAQGEARLALLALWAADVLIVQSLLWESGLGSAPDPDAQLAAVGRAVDSSLRDDSAPVDPSGSVTSALQRARTALLSTFDASVHAMLTERFVSPGHLDGLSVAGEGAVLDARRSRLGDRSAQELSEDLRVTAADCMAVSAWMARSGLAADAMAQARMADLASFEAYLVEAAVAVGDTSLATVDLRWDIATAAVENIIDLPAGLSDSVQHLREILLGAVGPAEGDALRATFEPVRVPAA